MIMIIMIIIIGAAPRRALLLGLELYQHRPGLHEADAARPVVYQ